MSTSSSCFELLAKSNPPHPLYRHMVDTGAVCTALLQPEQSLFADLPRVLASYSASDATPDEIIRTLSFLVSLHDLGKVHHQFQQMCQGKTQTAQGYRHEAGTKQYLLKIWKKKPEMRTKEHRKLRRSIATSLQLHHARDSSNFSFEEDLPQNLAYAEQLYDCLVEVFDPSFQYLEQLHHLSGFCTIVWGFTILCDWLASGEAGFAEIADHHAPRSYYQQSLELAETAVLCRSGMTLKPPLQGLPFSEMFPFIPPDGLRSLQQEAITISEQWSETTAPLLTIIEAPMGEGKTETALYLATKLGEYFRKYGIYVALPTSATSNQMNGRVTALLGTQNIDAARLLHSTAWLIDNETKSPTTKETDDNMPNFTQPLRRGLLGQYAVGTVDQIMMAVLCSRFSILRLMGATNKVIVIDEVHAYDRYMFTIIKSLLFWFQQLQIPVILLSATLPSYLKQEMLSLYQADYKITPRDLPYPLITCAGESGINHHLPVGDTAMQQRLSIAWAYCLSKPAEIAQIALAQAQHGGAIAVILNTVREAVAVYDALQQLLSQPEESRTQDNQTIELQLFHARFPLERRQKLEENCIAYFGKHNTHPRNRILVATQVVEQSLDLDFDAMITAIAPVDLLLQRAGRLHRHNRMRPQSHKNPLLTVLAEEDYGNERLPSVHVYEQYILQETQEVLRQHTDQIVCLPEDIRPLVEEVYRTPSEGEQTDGYFQRLCKQLFEEAQAQNNAFPSATPTDSFWAPDTSYDEDGSAVTTRLGEPSILLLLVRQSEYDQDPTQFDHPTQEQARNWMKRTVSIQKSRLKKDEELLHPAGGLLSGVWILRTDENDQFHGNQTIYHDDERGLCIC